MKKSQQQAKRQYICATCQGPLQYANAALGETGRGLGTWKCPKHPTRIVTVKRDFSGGKEADRQHRETPVTRTRHTAVKVILAQVVE